MPGKRNPMMLHIKRWLAPPVFPDDEIKTRRANLLNSALTNISILVPMLLIGDLLGGKSPLPSFAAEVLAFAFCLVLRSWMHRGRVHLASIGLITMGLVLITTVVAGLGTIRAPTTAMYLLVVINGGLLFGLRGMMITTALCSLLVGGLIGAENAGLLPRPIYSVTITQWVAYTVIFVWAGNLTFSSIQVMNQALTRADKEISDRKRAEKALQKAHHELELRVQERTTELEEANIALLESEARYRELTESIGEVFYAMDRNLRYTYWNNASEALTGISAKDAIGKSLFEIFPELKGSRAERLYTEVLKTQQPQRFVHQYRVEGKNLFFEINAYPSKFVISAIAKDITKRKQAEAALRESEERYRKLVEFSPDAISIHSEGKIVFINAAGAKLLGAANPEQLIGKSVIDFVHPEYQELAKERIRLMGEEGKNVSPAEQKFIKLDGSVIEVEVIAMPFTYQGKPGIQVIIRDITDRKRAEEALKQSEEKYRTLIDNIQDGVFIIQDAKIQFANEPFARIVGYTVKEIIGKDFNELIAPEDLEMVTDRYYRRQAGEDVPKEYEFRVLHKDGVTRILVSTNVGLRAHRKINSNF